MAKTTSSQLVSCEYCSKEFKSRGLTVHYRACGGKKAFDEEQAATAKLVPKYKFTIVNDDVFENVLSFLGNQSLVKLESITGDRYDNSDIELARWCCHACEDDKPATSEGLCYDGFCSECFVEMKGKYYEKIIVHQATDLYGITEFDGIPSEAGRKSTLYYRTDLDKHMIKLHGSVEAWLRSCATRKEQILKRTNKKYGIVDAVLSNKNRNNGGGRNNNRKKANRNNRNKAGGAVVQALESTHVGFQNYLRLRFITPQTVEQVHEFFGRYKQLVSALAARRLSLENDVYMHHQFIEHGRGDIELILQSMEEMMFMRAFTDFETRVAQDIQRFEQSWPGLSESLKRDDYDSIIQSIREKARDDVCLKYISEKDVSKAPGLPLLWVARWYRWRQVQMEKELDATAEPVIEYIIYGKILSK